MSDPTRVLPRLSVLSEAQIAKVHAYALEILARAGLRVDSARARDLVASKIGPDAVQGDRVILPRETVEWALKTAPRTIDLYRRTGEFAFRMGEGPARFGIGVTNLYYQQPEDNDVVPFARQHMETCVRLGDALPRYDVVSTIGILQDLPPDEADLYAVLEMAANTTKPLVVLISEPKLFEPSLDLLAHLFGDLSAKPFIVPYVNPITPLVANEDTLDKVFASIDRGLPVIYSNYGMVGMSTPITPAGTLALLTAELLGGLTLAQLYKEGTPMILGSLPAYFDMREMIDFFDPRTMLLNAACAEMMAHYGLPHAGTSGSGAGWGPDLPEMGTMWVNHLTSCLGHSGLAPFVGSILGSLAFSPVTALYAHDIIGQARHFADGFTLDDAHVRLEDIVNEGPAGNYLGTDLTIEHFRTAYYKSDVYPPMSLEKWQAQGQPDAADHLRQYALDFMAGLKPPADHDDLIARGEAFIKDTLGQ